MLSAPPEAREVWMDVHTENARHHTVDQQIIIFSFETKQGNSCACSGAVAKYGGVVFPDSAQAVRIH
jgi:hypothetical protein